MLHRKNEKKAVKKNYWTDHHKTQRGITPNSILPLSIETDLKQMFRVFKAIQLVYSTIVPQFSQTILNTYSYDYNITQHRKDI